MFSVNSLRSILFKKFSQIIMPRNTHTHNLMSPVNKISILIFNSDTLNLQRICFYCTVPMRALYYIVLYSKMSFTNMHSSCFPILLDGQQIWYRKYRFILSLMQLNATKFHAISQTSVSIRHLYLLRHIFINASHINGRSDDALKTQISAPGEKQGT